MKTSITELSLNFHYPYATEQLWHQYAPIVTTIHHHLHDGKPEMTDWMTIDVPSLMLQLSTLQSLIDRMKDERAVLIVIAIGGSAQGTKALLESGILEHEGSSDAVEVVFAGHLLDPYFLTKLMASLEHRSVYLNFISKSGTTMEPTLAYNELVQWMERKYGSEKNERIIITTDESNERLLDFIYQEGYKALTIPTGIGGRFSVFTNATLFPLKAAGINVLSFLQGASNAMREYESNQLERNNAYKYAVLRHMLFEQNYKIELIASFQPSLDAFFIWWQQLFAESEGKNGKGLYPSSANYPSDLHSIGQFVQQGSPVLFETFLSFKQDEMSHFNEKKMPTNAHWPYVLPNQSLIKIQEALYEGVKAAHISSNIPIIEISLEKKNNYSLGYLMYFFMKACAMSAYLLKVNPFDQPGVEVYKQQFLKLLHQHSV
jgi:glucose-6-phosphate isomerase